MLAGFLLLCVQGGFGISSYAFSKLFHKYFWPFFYHGFRLNVPKVVVLNVLGHDFNFLNVFFLHLTVSWPCCLATLSQVFWFGFFLLFKSYFMVYKIQNIVKFVFYGHS